MSESVEYCAVCGDEVYQSVALRDPHQVLWLHKNGTLYENDGVAPHKAQPR